MTIDENVMDSHDVDKGLVTMFINMSPEERLQANDNAVRTIQELRDAYKQETSGNVSKRYINLA